MRYSVGMSGVFSLLRVAVWPGALVACACSGPAESKPAADAVADIQPAEAVACTPGTADCCPAHQVWDAAKASCVAPGPTGCSSGAACWPGWCWDGRDAVGQPCAQGTQGCVAGGRACTPEEIASGKSCPAGTWRPTPEAACVEAGTNRPVSDLAAAADASLLAPLPPMQSPSWCGTWTAPSGTDCTTSPEDCVLLPVPCTPGTAAQACPVGSYRLPSAPAACTAAGVAWSCPPGTVSNGKGDPGLPDCQAAAADCGAGPYAAADMGPGGTGLGDRIYVDASAGPGGDGSWAKPVQSVAEAMAQLDKQPAAAVIALAAGNYPGKWPLTRSVTLRGRCAAQVQLGAAKGSLSVRVSGADVHVRVEAATFVGPGSALQVSDGARLTATRVLAVNCEETAMAAFDSGSVLELTDAYVVDTHSGTAQGAVSVWASTGAQVRAVRVRVSRGKFAGLYSTEDSAIAAREIIVDAVASATGLESGMGIYANDTSTLHVVGGLLRKHRASAIWVTGGTVSLTGVSFDGSMGQPQTPLMAGAVNCDDASDVTIAAPLIRNVVGLGIIAGGKSSLVVGGADIADLAEGLIFDNPVGILLGDGARAKVYGTQVGPIIGTGYGVLGKGTRLDGADLHVGPNALTSATVAHGLDIQLGANVAIDGLRASKIQGIGILTKGEGSSLVLRHAILDDCATPGSHDPTSGAGMIVSFDAAAFAEDIWVHRSQVVAVHVGDGATLSMAGLLVDNAGHDFYSATDGFGVHVGAGSAFNLAGARVLDSRFSALTIGEGEPTAHVAGILISDRYGISQPKVMQAGSGISVLTGTLQVGGARVERVQQTGLYAAAAHLTCSDTAIVEVGQGRPDEAAPKLADAVVLQGTLSANLDRLQLSANRRAGLVTENIGAVQVSGATIVDNAYGVVVVNGKNPTLVTSQVASNGVANMASDKGLALPPPPATAVVPTN